MKDQYYSQEENLPDTPETALANLDAATRQIASFVPQAAADLNRTEQALGFAYEQAAGSPEAQAEIAEAWQIIQRTTQKLVQIDTVRQLAETAAKKAQAKLAKVEEHKKLLEDEYDELSDAMAEAENNGYSTHPRISALIEALQEEEAEEFEAALYLENPGLEACANGWFDCLAPDAVDNLCYALFTPDANLVDLPMREKTAEFINWFGDEMDKRYFEDIGRREDEMNGFFATMAREEDGDLEADE